METSNNQTSLFTEDKLMSSQEGSPVNHSPQRGSEKERKMTAIYGPKCLEQFGRFNRATLWARTFAASLIGNGDWYSTRCRLIWKLKATKSSRFYFQLVPSTPHTGGTEFGLLPTPSVADTEGSPKRPDQISQNAVGGWQRTIDTTGTKFGAKLNDVARLLKTPTKMDGEVSSGKKNPVSGDSGTLAQEIMSGYGPTMITLGLLPTPAARDFRSPHAEQSESFQTRQEHSRGVNLVEHLQRLQDGKTSQLNPRFVAEMMGFPPDYLELPFLDTEKNP